MRGRTRAHPRTRRKIIILGVGGSAGNAGHAVNDFRKICGFEAYAPTDNVSELTARTTTKAGRRFSPMVKRQPHQFKRRPADFFRRRWQPGKKRQPESRQRDSTCQKSWRGGDRHCRTRRRIHGEGSDGLRDCPDCKSNARHAAQRGVSGNRLASARVASETESRADEMGIHKIICRSRGNEAKFLVKQMSQSLLTSAATKLRKAVFLDRDGVINRALERDAKPFPPGNLGEFEFFPKFPLHWQS